MNQPSSMKRRIVALDTSKPAELFGTRTLRSLATVHEMFWNEAGRLYLLVPHGADPELLSSHGAEVDRHGAFIRRDSQIDHQALERVLPYVARRAIQPRLADLIPQTSWGANLCNMLTAASWDALRQGAFALTGSRCEICGVRQGLECHEEWEYHEPNGLEKVPEGYMALGVQRLVRLMPLCDDCHETYHLGFAYARGRLAERLQRIAAFNRWSQHEVDAYYDFIGARWKRRNQYMWALDVSAVSDQVLTVQKRWRYSERVLHTRMADGGETATMLLGVEWRYAGSKEIQPILSPDTAYLES